MPSKYKEIEFQAFDDSFAKIYDLFVEEAKDGDSIVELGSWYGGSSCYLLEKIQESGKNIKVWFIDTFTGNQEGKGSIIGHTLESFKSNLFKAGFKESYNNEWKVVVIDSIEAANLFKDDEVFAILIDDDHQTDHVDKELKAWIPKTRLIGMHDYNDHKVRTAIEMNQLQVEDRGTSCLYRKQ